MAVQKFDTDAARPGIVTPRLAALIRELAEGVRRALNLKVAAPLGKGEFSGNDVISLQTAAATTGFTGTRVVPISVSCGGSGSGGSGSGGAGTSLFVTYQTETWLNGVLQSVD